MQLKYIVSASLHTADALDGLPISAFGVFVYGFFVSLHIEHVLDEPPKLSV